MIRLLIADDHAIVREGINKIFAITLDIRVAAEAVTGLEVLKALKSGEEFDMLLLDLSMPDVNGTDLISKIKDTSPGLPILVFSMHNEPQIVSRAIRAGSSGFVSKDSDPEVLIEAVRRVAGGGKFIGSALAEQLAFDALLPEQRAPHLLLSEREFEVFGHLVKGKRVNEIADLLHISNKTVSTHKLNMMVKMQLNSTADLVHYAVMHHLFTT
jgi:DNA-binding NarL/FixJ family response regulator